MSTSSFSQVKGNNDLSMFLTEAPLHGFRDHSGKTKANTTGVSASKEMKKATD